MQINIFKIIALFLLGTAAFNFVALELSLVGVFSIVKESQAALALIGGIFAFIGLIITFIMHMEDLWE